MAQKSNRPPGRIKSSIVARLNTQLFFRLLGQAGVNILTVHQSIPINRQADISLSMEVLEDSWPIEEILDQLQKVPGVHSIKVLARE